LRQPLASGPHYLKDSEGKKIATVIMVFLVEFWVVLVKNATLLAMDASAADDHLLPIMIQVSNMAMYQPKV
jgi:hypothetical protein